MKYILRYPELRPFLSAVVNTTRLSKPTAPATAASLPSGRNPLGRDEGN